MTDANAARPTTEGIPALLRDTPLRAIIRLAVPNTAVMLVATLSNVFQTYFVSRLGADAIAAISLVFPIALIVMTVMGAGLGTGVASGIARALGRGRGSEAGHVAEHALALCAVAMLGFTTALELGTPILFRAMGGRGEVLQQATLFGRTLFAGVGIGFYASTFDAILRGEGNVRVPALCAALSLSLQIVLTPLYMFVFGLGLIGAPLATLSGQAIGILPRARYVLGGYAGVKPRLFPLAPRRRHFAEILRVGVPASLSATLNYVALMVLTGILAHFGNAHLAAYGLGTRVDFLLFSLGYGFAAALLTLVGMATGAQRWDLLGRYVRQTALLVLAVVGPVALLVITHPHLWLGIFTQEPDIHRVGAEYFRIIGPSYFFSVVTMIFASAFQGVGRAVIPLFVMILRVTVVIGGALFLANQMETGAEPIFAMIAATNVGACLLSGTLFVRLLRRVGRERPA